MKGLNSSSAPRRSKRGFTLVELMIVVGIIFILMLLCRMLYMSYVAHSKRTEVAVLLTQLVNDPLLCDRDDEVDIGPVPPGKPDRKKRPASNSSILRDSGVIDPFKGQDLYCSYRLSIRPEDVLAIAICDTDDDGTVSVLALSRSCQSSGSHGDPLASFDVGYSDAEGLIDSAINDTYPRIRTLKAKADSQRPILGG